MVRGIQYDVTTELPEYLSDESRQIGSADSISFPESADELRDHLRYAAVRHQAVTVQGARTGITAGAVPEGGHILNLSRMKNILSFEENTAPRITVQPGLTLTELRWAIHEETGGKWFFPPDPTEASATVGGMIACNASGARSFCYGAVRKYVTALRVMLIDGSKLFLRRGISRSQGRDFELVTDDGRRVTGQLPTYSLPSVKNASGYFVQDSMDLLDLLVGSEGTLGVVYEAELSLKPSLPVQFSLLAFLPDDNTAVQIVNRLRRRKAAGHGGLIALEFFDEKALNLIREQPAAGEFGLPSTSGPALYFEYHGDGNNFLEDRIREVSQCMEEYGADPEQAWLATTEKEGERLKTFRHAVPEAVNRIIGERKKTSPGITKLGTDLAVPDDRLADVMQMYREDLERIGLDSAIFGHIGDNHLHVNIMPKNTDEYIQGRALYRKWACAAVRMGGTVSAEHGIGKLKRELLEQMYGKDGVEEMRRLKRCFDPDGLLNRGNLFQ